MWERRLDTAVGPDVRLFVRDNLMDTGQLTPSPAGVAAAFDDPLQGVALGDPQWWWQCADIKVDALAGTPPAYQMPVAKVDYVAFESRLAHRNAQRGQVNRIYVQVHNQGISDGANVAVKVLWADASAGLPSLPADFWTAFPGDSANTANWHPIGAAKSIASLPRYLPGVLEWDWTTPLTAATHSCLLVVVDGASDPIPAASKGFDVNALVQAERRVGLKNLHVVNAPPGTAFGAPLRLRGRANVAYRLRLQPHRARDWSIGFILPRSMKQPALTGIEIAKPSAAVLKQLRQQLGHSLDAYDTTRLYRATSLRGGHLDGIKIGGAGATVLVLLTAPAGRPSPQSVTILQEAPQRVVGGSTYVLQVARAR
jgi:hypothetical protein